MPDGTLVDMPDELSPELGKRLRAFQSSGGKKPEDQLSAGMAQLEQLQPSVKPKPVAAPSFGQRLLGAGETALTMGTGSIAAPVGQMAGIARGLVGGNYGTPQG